MAQVLTAPALKNSGVFTGDALRSDALARLYKRRDAVDDLIRCLEEYQNTSARRAEIISITAFAKCS